MRKSKPGVSADLRRGFTIVELVVTVMVFAVLTGIVTTSTFGYQESARNRERANDIDAIARSLEQYYRTQSGANGASYPNSATTATALAAIVKDNDIVIAPRQTTNSLVVATSNAAQTPTISQYIYQPLNANGTLCTAVPCARYKLYFRQESSNTIVTKDSLRQQ
jgi:prepilin-type N-terminal cleavage/methylation domain-containing protein